MTCSSSLTVTCLKIVMKIWMRQQLNPKAVTCLKIVVSVRTLSRSRNQKTKSSEQKKKEERTNQ